MTRQRCSSDLSFELEVIRMIKKQGLSISNVRRTMDIGEAAIHRELTQYEAEQGQPGIGKPVTPDRQRIRQLDQENCQFHSDMETSKKT